VAACHDCSEGGLAAALAEMSFAGGVGMEIDLAAVPCARDVARDDQLLFSESVSRFVLEIEPEKFGKVAGLFKDIRFGQIGKVTDTSQLTIKNANNKTVIDANIAELKEAWQAPLRW